jgi:hypothetical protein
VAGGGGQRLACLPGVREGGGAGRGAHEGFMLFRDSQLNGFPNNREIIDTFNWDFSFIFIENQLIIVSK